jgi:hypothetical protein
MTNVQHMTRIFALSTLTLMLSACGGGGGSSDSSSNNNAGGNNSTAPTTPTNPTTPTTPNSSDLFTIKGQTWAIAPTKDTAYCYDIDTQKEVENCSGQDWDLKFYMGTRTPALFTNSGVSGSGSGGVLSSPFNVTWLDLVKEKDATQSGSIPSAAWVVDSYSNAFMDTKKGFNSFFEYDLFGDHRMSPNFKTYLLSTDPNSKNVIGSAEKPVFALQITGYYQGTTSGHIALRYIDTNKATEIKTLSVDASKGWTYVNLATGMVSPTREGTWHIAFNRYNVEVNNTVGSTIANQPDGFYDAEGNVITDKFKDSNAVEATKTALTEAAKLTTVTRWGSNSVNSLLNPAFQGNYPNKLSYGWYYYYPTLAAAQADGLQKEHTLAANPNAASMIRSNTGKSYARIHLKEIKYADPTDFNSQTTWTFEFDIQPAK